MEGQEWRGDLTLIILQNLHLKLEGSGLFPDTIAVYLGLHLSLCMLYDPSEGS